MLGLPELSVLAAAAVAVVVIGIAQVLLRNVRLDVLRTARPSRVAQDDPCEIRLAVKSSGRRQSPVVELTDDAGIFGSARLKLAPIRPGATTVATYSLPTNRRGRFLVGPMTVALEDPFGTARRTRVDRRRTAVIVTPRTWPLVAMPPAPGDEPDHGTHSLTTASTVDDEFASLRDYVAGDDIRRIHWRSSARRGTPVVRQFDVPWQRRTTVIADLRADRHDSASFERLMSCVASIFELAAERAELIRLVTTDETSATYRPAEVVLEMQLDRLATLGPSNSHTPPDQLLAWIGRSSTSRGGRVVTCVGGLIAAEQTALADAARPSGLHVVVSTRSGSGGVAVPGALLVEWDGSTGLDEVWNRVMTTHASRMPA